MFLAVVRRRDRHRRAPGGANVDGLQAVAPHPPGQVAHEGARRVANRGGAHRALQHGGEEGAEELVRDGPQLLFALLRFLCRPGRWSTRLKLQRPPEGSAQVDGNVAKIDLAARGVDGALVHFNAPSWAVRAVMSSTTLPVCPKTGSTSPSLTVHLCLHTAPGNRECARGNSSATQHREAAPEPDPGAALFPAVRDEIRTNAETRFGHPAGPTGSPQRQPTATPREPGRRPVRTARSVRRNNESQNGGNLQQREPRGVSADTPRGVERRTYRERPTRTGATPPGAEVRRNGRGKGRELWRIREVTARKPC